MSNAKLTRIELSNFKPFGKEPQHIDLRPLTVLIGRNNTGKSSVIQSLLLLKQTLIRPDLPAEVPLSLEGLVNALSLSALTHGWPEGDFDEAGPVISLEWETLVDVRQALKTGRRRMEDERIAKLSNLPWLVGATPKVWLRTRLELRFAQSKELVQLPSIQLRSVLSRANKADLQNPGVSLGLDRKSGAYQVRWNGDKSPSGTINAEVEHFLPFLRPTSDAGQYGRARSYAFRVLYEQPLNALRDLLVQFTYLGSLRSPPHTIYRPPDSLPKDVGVSGEFAAQLLFKGQRDVVHYLPLPEIEAGTGRLLWPERVLARPLLDALNDCYRGMGLLPDLKVQSVQGVGFQLLYGRAGLDHVGRGIGYLLPVVVAMLFADPLRGERPEEMSLEQYLKAIPQPAHLGLEEPETATFPKLQTQLAHLFVALARCGRRLLIETHSDHLVRRLRGLVARAPRGSEAERWLLDNVAIVEVEQDAGGATRLTQSVLTVEGGIAERWPKDFIEEGPQEEQSISFVGMDKTLPEAVSAQDSYLASIPKVR